MTVQEEKGKKGKAKIKIKVVKQKVPPTVTVACVTANISWWRPAWGFGGLCMF